MASRTRALVSPDTHELSCSTSDTVARDTPHSRAMSNKVTLLTSRSDC